MAQLELFEENDYDVNTFLIDSLVKPQALEAAPLIERAFAADRVEEFMMGDWDDIQVGLGLKSAEEVEEKRIRERAERRQSQEIAFPSIEDEDEDMEFAPSNISHKKAAGHKKAKNKMAKESRKKNRKR